MELLKREKKETFYFGEKEEWVQRNGVTEKGSSNEIKIIFINDNFSHVDFDFSGKYTRDQWRLMVEIEKEISMIEDMIRCHAKPKTLEGQKNDI